MKIRVDTSRCVGAGQCVWVAPQVFDQREEDGIVRVLLENPPEDLQDFAREAAKVCPAQVIQIIEESSP